MTDRIEKHVVLQAPVSRVWRAISDAQEFAQWFGLKLDGPFVVGQGVHGVWEGDLPHAQIAEYQKKLGLEPSPLRVPPPEQVFCTVEAIEPEKRFVFRWVPFGIDASVDVESEPTTLVEFTLKAEGAASTHLTIVESGFDKVPAHRRKRAFLMNDAGWSGQADNIKRFVEKK